MIIRPLQPGRHASCAITSSCSEYLPPFCFQRVLIFISVSREGAEALPYVGPLHIASEQLREMAKAQVDVHDSDSERREGAGQRQRAQQPHLNSSTVANGSADPGRSIDTC